MSSSSDDWSTRHSVLATARRTAALVNALAAEHADTLAITSVLRDFGETGPITLTPDDVAGMREAAVLLREVFAAEHADTAATALNRLLRDHTGQLRLTSHGGGSPWHPHLDEDDESPWEEWFLSSSCMALTVLVWDSQRPPGAVCASPGCRDVFLARGSGPERRYCSRRCATRERVAAHRRARSSTGLPVSAPAEAD
ncbi:CGNR zinc finger domain-containing protein [Streptomyces sp. NBC_00102]|uniref:CGNR zinc finger domain-containing protein n=1 Tax=Streptomyces sp. NBC_00102 TaxID=2975652 RepID=UPI002252BB0D|nr:CGNR zinc finger domain-containing protein [Streptomyces sp. NBC_00102]MCX5401948.1 CGNR zinc finger domain-containing protein [Streptomyces sp. NBC_00102]